MAAFKEPRGLEERRRGSREEEEEEGKDSAAKPLSSLELRLANTDVLSPSACHVLLLFFLVLCRLSVAALCFSLFVIGLQTPESVPPAHWHWIPASSAWIDAGGINSCVILSRPLCCTALVRHQDSKGSFVFVCFYSLTIVRPQMKPGRNSRIGVILLLVWNNCSYVA